MENTIAKGKNKFTETDNIMRDYTDWFPSAQLSFEPNENFNYSLDYRRSITRPSYGNLSSGGLHGSPYIEYRGNPFLLPSYSNTLALNAKLKNGH
jgi:outer membrane receptor protein involved in Fe transport